MVDSSAIERKISIIEEKTSRSLLSVESKKTGSSGRSSSLQEQGTRVFEKSYWELP